MKKKIHEFFHTKNIANFGAFCWNIWLSTNLLFLQSEAFSLYTAENALLPIMHE